MNKNISAHQRILGLPLDSKFWYTGNLDQLEAFEAFKAVRWGTVRRYGNRNCLLVAQLDDGRVYEVRLVDNPESEGWLREHRQVARVRTPWSGRNDPGIRVYWNDPVPAV